ncbi:hypothetical protein PAHAL_9G217900 [Panicum hallii]|uniref:Uncharacterized protein n=1 Tax=Panicum hallii TaxID=206008 RepID=A0A2T8I254_9POAL|nr:hypothetical protein PAHAL_9G217900 [Panicum hallii]
MLWNGLSSFYIIPYIILVLKSNMLHLYHFLSLFGDVGTIMCLGPSCLVLPLLKHTFLFIVCTFISVIRDMTGHATRAQCSSLYQGRKVLRNSGLPGCRPRSFCASHLFAVCNFEIV